MPGKQAWDTDLPPLFPEAQAKKDTPSVPKAVPTQKTDQLFKQARDWGRMVNP